MTWQQLKARLEIEAAHETPANHMTMKKKIQTDIIPKFDMGVLLFRLREDIVRDEGARVLRASEIPLETTLEEVWLGEVAGSGSGRGSGTNDDGKVQGVVEQAKEGT